MTDYVGKELSTKAFGDGALISVLIRVASAINLQFFFGSHSQNSDVIKFISSFFFNFAQR